MKRPWIKKIGSALLCLSMLVSLCACRREPEPFQPGNFRSVPFSRVTLQDSHWSAIQKWFVCQVVPIGMANISTEKGGIDNFRRAAEYLRTKKGSYTTENAPGHRGAVYVDSDVYKVIEAMCYALQLDAQGDGEILSAQASIREKLELWIPWILGAQEADGYLQTAYTLHRTDSPIRFTGRTDDMPVRTDGSPYDTVGTEAYQSVNFKNHELYCAGHFYEAAVAHYRATGDTRLLEAAVKNADLVARTFGYGEDQVFAVPGHAEIELALVKLAQLCRETGEYSENCEAYFATARFFLDAKGHRNYDGSNADDPAYYQNDIPVAQQRQAYGHCVRAQYLYCAMTDIALMETEAGRENPYSQALPAIYEDILTKTYITGGLGIQDNRESFGASHELPNDAAYCETCAQISNLMWNRRMSQLYPDSRYADQAEWTLYNSVMSCIGLDGDRFFYENPLVGTPEDARSAWFGTACCPSNLMRTVLSLGGYIYAQDEQGNITVDQYIGNTARLDAARVTMSGSFPWQGSATLTVEEADGRHFAIRFRVPGWADGENIISLNGNPLSAQADENGYVTVFRQWAAGDRVELNFPMEARRLYTQENEGLTAVGRGPILYCAESADNPGMCSVNVSLPRELPLVAGQPQALSGRSGTGAVETVVTVTCGSLTLIPYYAWNNRGPGYMTVYLTE